MSTPISLFENRAELEEFCRGHHIAKLSLYGSRLTGKSRPDSDIDLLVEFEPGKKPGLIGLSELELALSVMLGGRKVDLRTAEDLSRHFRGEVLRTAAVQYAA